MEQLHIYNRPTQITTHKTTGNTVVSLPYGQYSIRPQRKVVPKGLVEISTFFDSYPDIGTLINPEDLEEIKRYAMDVRRYTGGLLNTSLIIGASRILAGWQDPLIELVIRNEMNPKGPLVYYEYMGNITPTLSQGLSTSYPNLPKNAKVLALPSNTFSLIGINPNGTPHFFWDRQYDKPKAFPLVSVDIENIPTPNRWNTETRRKEPSLPDLIRPLSQYLRYILGEPPNRILSLETMLIQSIAELVVTNFLKRR